MHSFGASDCWSMAMVGKYYPESKKRQIAEWLFSLETDRQGNPKGIGLSLWLFNIGAGSYEQAEIVIDKKSHELNTGQGIIIPAHKSQIVIAHERFKMISTVIKSGYE